MALAQGPSALATFTSADGAFQFVYPQTYDLLVGERILKATQGRRLAVPFCDFSTALACVIYPIETPDDTRFEAVGFSAGLVPGVTAESDCLTYADQLARSHDEPLRTLIHCHQRSRISPRCSQENPVWTFASRRFLPDVQPAKMLRIANSGLLGGRIGRVYRTTAFSAWLPGKRKRG